MNRNVRPGQPCIDGWHGGVAHANRHSPFFCALDDALEGGGVVGDLICTGFDEQAGTISFNQPITSLLKRPYPDGLYFPTKAEARELRRKAWLRAKQREAHERKARRPFSTGALLW